MNHRFEIVRNGLSRLSMCFFAMLICSTIFAAELEEVIVTAQKTEEGMQEVPLAVSAYTGEALSQANVVDLVELTQFSPSLRFVRGGNLRNSGLGIRGIGSSGQNAGIDGSVGLYLDGVYIPRPAGLMGSLSDISSVEILKGPQGTLFGANTPAGLINVNTNDPTDEFEARIQVGVGEYDTSQISGYVSGAITDDVNARLSYWNNSDDGYVKTKTDGDTNSMKDWGVRLKAIWALSEDTEIEFSADYSDQYSKCCNGEWLDISDEALTYFGIMSEGLNLDQDKIFPSRVGKMHSVTKNGETLTWQGEKLDHVSYSQSQTFDDIEHWGISANLTTTVLDGHTLTLVGSYRDWDTNQAQDQDEVGIDVSVWMDQPENHEYKSVELNLISPDDSPIYYVAGLYYYQDDGFFWQQSQLRLPGCMYSRNVQNRVNSGALEDTADARSRCAGHGRSDQWEQDWESMAAYVQASYDITDRWSVTVGGRITQDEKSVDKTVRLFDDVTEANYAEQGLNCPLCTFTPGNPTANNLGILFGTQGFKDSIDNTESTYSISTQYTFADDMMVYVRFATGYKAPGINARPIRFPTIPTNYDEEISENLEVGVKSTWLDNRLRINIALYDNDFDDLQQIASNPSSDPTGAVGTFVQNAGNLVNRGFELDYEYHFNDSLSFFGAYSYLDSEYKEYDRSPCPGKGFVPRSSDIPTLCDYSGLENVATPESRMNHSVRYVATLTGEINWFAQASWIYNDDMYVTSDLDERGFVDSYSLIDISAGLQNQDGDWDLTFFVKNVDDEVYITGLINGAVPGLFGNRGSKIVRLGEPRWWGARFAMNF